MTEEEVQKALTERFGEDMKGLSAARPRRIFVEIPREKLVELLAFVRDGLGFTHLSTLTGLDAGDCLEVLYHIGSPGLLLTVRVRRPWDDPRLPSILGVFPNAEWYEREVEDLLGATFEGLPPGRRYPLPDDFPAGQHPLRKNWKREEALPKAD